MTRASKIPLLRLSEVIELSHSVTDSPIRNQQTLLLALRLFKDLGLIVWLEDVEALRERVFIRPQWIVDVLKAIVRHDMFIVEEDKNAENRLMKAGVSADDQKSLHSQGFISVTALERLWEIEKGLNLSADQQEVSMELMLAMDLCRRFDDDGQVFMFPHYLPFPKIDSVWKRYTRRARKSFLKRISFPVQPAWKVGRLYNFYVTLPYGLFGRLIAWLPPYLKLKPPSAHGEIKAEVALEFIKPVTVVMREVRSLRFHTGYIQLTPRLCAEAGGGCDGSFNWVDSGFQ